jgi:hypothetical protein
MYTLRLKNDRVSDFLPDDIISRDNKYEKIPPKNVWIIHTLDQKDSFAETAKHSPYSYLNPTPLLHELLDQILLQLVGAAGNRRTDRFIRHVFEIDFDDSSGGNLSVQLLEE